MSDAAGSAGIEAAFGPALARQPSCPASQWFQDHVQIGYTATPQASMHITLRMPYDHPSQQDWPVTDLLGPAVGLYRFENTGGDEPEYGGNLEIVPYSDEWPAGRIVHGSNMVNRMPAFLDDQTSDGANAMQSPFGIDVGWLYVGHVDEIVSFLPGGSRGYKVLLASPSYAEQLIKTGDPDRGIPPPPDHAAVFATGAEAHGIASNSIATEERVYLFDGAAHGHIQVVAEASITDGDYVTISDGGTAETFEFDKSGGVHGGRVPVPLTGGMTATQVRDALLNAIAGTGLAIDAEPDGPIDKILLINRDLGVAGNVNITHTVRAAGFMVQGMSGGEPLADGRDFTVQTPPWGYIRIYDGTGAGQVGVIQDRGRGWVSVEDPTGQQDTVYETPSTACWVTTQQHQVWGVYYYTRERPGQGSVPRSTAWLPEPHASSRYIVVEDCPEWPDSGGKFPAVLSVFELKNDNVLWQLNAAAQTRIHAAKGSIQTAMGNENSPGGGVYLLNDGDITDDALAGDLDDDFVVVPVVYFGEWNGALVNGVNMAFVPGLANVQPANPSTMVFPKPYGPRANGDDVFESAVSSIIGPLAAKFADDWELYHILVGEVHCATAAKRQVPSGNWWEYQP